ncbi:transglycosylase domain-containing protein [Candidatus Nardonella dryophthoridicola]|uniref:transglycosylase domain-containing protein n=1 Tax=Candidatus Nardonella dryophthoridicola TaxID=1971485 RepID=UPI001AD8794A|nr:transglycosylase domain-containing protein [Candidatus Nardonella dryophthoridicola]QTJ62830.1 transglycosylase domain-containing protein [Candidatus Nardonella dryophthoridicola]
MHFHKNVIFKLLFIFITFYIIFNLYIKNLNSYISNYLQNKNNNFLLYSKIFKISKKKNFYKNKIIDILLNHNYNLSKFILKPGDLIINKNNLIFYHRYFNYIKKIDKNLIIKIKFKNNKLYKIINICKNKKINKILINPIIINLINYDKKSNINYCNFIFNINIFPRILLDILILIEDKNFYNHYGINFKSIIRALLQNIYKLKFMQGASTITQQLSRNIFLNNKKNIIRKLKEIFISFCIEKNINKNRIIELYLNKVFLGQSGNIKINGFYLASLYYYNKYIYELNINELIILVSMLKGLNYNPIRNYNLSLNRRNMILLKLKNNDLINEKLYYQLVNKKIKINLNNKIKNKYWCYTSKVYKEIKDIKYDFNFNNNYEIFSNIDILKYNSFKKSINIFNKKNNYKNFDFLSIMVNKRGKLINLFYSLNFNIINNINKIYKKKHIGSLIKPILNSIILDVPFNFRLDTNIPNSKLYIEDNNNKWIPKNHNEFYSNNVTLLDSLINSLNIPYINIGYYIGLKNVLKKIYYFLEDKNILKLNNDSIFIGSLDLSIIELSQIYQTIYNNGNLIKIGSIKYIIDNNNNIIYSNKYNIFKKIISNRSCLLTLYNMKKVTELGTAVKLNKFNFLNIFSKTGTTKNYINNWFIGIDGEDICIIWIGNYNNIKNFNFKPINIYFEYLNNYKYNLKNIL